jgi:hypothetical protein
MLHQLWLFRVRRGHLQVSQVNKWTYFFRQISREWHTAQNPAWEQITQESQTFEKMALQLSTQDGVILKQGMGTTGYEAQQMPTIITAQGVDGFKQRTLQYGWDI